MDVLSELLKPYNLVYVVPIAMAGMLTILRRVGFDVDFLAVLDLEHGETGTGRGGALRRLAARVFPPGELNIVRVALFAVAWASTGLVLNRVFHRAPVPYLHLATFIVACGTGIVVAGLGSRVFHFLLPAEERTSSLADLVGATAIVISDVVDEAHGRARVMDAAGSTVTVFCRHVGGGEHPAFGGSVTLVRYDPQERVFDAMP